MSALRVGTRDVVWDGYVLPRGRMADVSKLSYIQAMSILGKQNFHTV